MRAISYVSDAGKVRILKGQMRLRNDMIWWNYKVICGIKQDALNERWKVGVRG